MSTKYKRIILKLSGEALAGSDRFGTDFEKMQPIVKAIEKCHKSGTQIGIVIGGGNFWRGRSSGNMDRVKADHMGMLATVINALGLSDALERIGVESQILTAIPFPQIGKPYSPVRAIKSLEKGKIVIFGYGTGNAFFSTDTAASLRAAEISADAILKATNIDGVYDSDPETNPDAKKYDEVTFDEVLAKNLKVMDASSISMCRDNKIDVLVFSVKNPENLVLAVSGENPGTFAHA